MALAASRHALAERDARVAEMLRYQSDYQSGPASGMVTSADALRRRASFLGVVDSALAGAREARTRAAEDLEASEAAWRARHARTRAVAALIERVRRVERRAALRHEQRQLDERAARAGGGGWGETV